MGHGQENFNCREEQTISTNSKGIGISKKERWFLGRKHFAKANDVSRSVCVAKTFSDNESYIAQNDEFSSYESET